MQRLGDNLINLRFESLVNSVRCKTVNALQAIKRRLRALLIQWGAKQRYCQLWALSRLRALLIQWGAKHNSCFFLLFISLRALLIQWGAKHTFRSKRNWVCLRALLIQWGAKPWSHVIDAISWFESLVNSVRCKTRYGLRIPIAPFESLVNSVRCKTNERSIKWQ